MGQNRGYWAQSPRGRQAIQTIDEQGVSIFLGRNGSFVVLEGILGVPSAPQIGP